MVHQHLKVIGLEPNVPLPYTFVTILVDQINFTDFVPKYNSDVRLSGHVSWVGRSSVEVVVWLEQMDAGKWTKITRAVFLMGSRNATNTKSLPVNPLVPATDEERKIFDGGEKRKERRLLTQNKSPFAHIPSTDEQNLVHELFMKTIDTNSQKMNSRILPAGCVWMEDCIASSIIFSHPEDRNAHNTVFGGFLMRHALELSWTLAYKYAYVFGFYIT